MRVIRKEKFEFDGIDEKIIKLPAGSMDDTVDEFYVNIEEVGDSEVSNLSVLGKIDDSFFPISLVNMGSYKVAGAVKKPGMYLLIPGACKEIKIEGSKIKGAVAVLGE